MKTAEESWLVNRSVDANVGTVGQDSLPDIIYLNYPDAWTLWKWRQKAEISSLDV